MDMVHDWDAVWLMLAFLVVGLVVGILLSILPGFSLGAGVSRRMSKQNPLDAVEKDVRQVRHVQDLQYTKSLYKTKEK